MRASSVEKSGRRRFERDIEKAFRSLRRDGSNSVELSDDLFEHYGLDRRSAVPIILRVFDRLSRAESEHRGDRSSLWDVGLPRQGQCTLKRHFIGCLRQVVGLAEKLAANDPDRFVWAGRAFFIKHALKQRNGGYKPRQVYDSVLVAELLGVFGAEEQRLRNGVIRTGFTMVSHASVTTETNSRCVLKLKRMNNFSSRVRGEKRSSSRRGRDTAARAVSAREAASSATPSATGNLISATPSATKSRPECIAECNTECNTKSSDLAHPPEVDDQSRAKYVQKGEQKCASEPSNPVKSTHKPSKSKPSTPTSPLIFPDDSDVTNTNGQGVTVGEWFRSVDNGGDIVESISDGEFDAGYLAKYKHLQELTDSCRLAIEQLSRRSFSGRTTCAAVMGKAMEILRANHNANAPRGWIPVMKKLRNGGDLRIMVPVCEPAQEPAFVVPAEEVLTHPFSALNAIDSEKELLTIAEKQSNLLAHLVQLAKDRGVPGDWREALAFVDDLLSQIGTNPTPILLTIRDRLRGRVSELDLPRLLEK